MTHGKIINQWYAADQTPPGGTPLEIASINMAKGGGGSTPSFLFIELSGGMSESMATTDAPVMLAIEHSAKPTEWFPFGGMCTQEIVLPLNPGGTYTLKVYDPSGQTGTNSAYTYAISHRVGWENRRYFARPDAVYTVDGSEGNNDKVIAMSYVATPEVQNGLGVRIANDSGATFTWLGASINTDGTAVGDTSVGSTTATGSGQTATNLNARGGIHTSLGYWTSVAGISASETVSLSISTQAHPR